MGFGGSHEGEPAAAPTDSLTLSLRRDASAPASARAALSALLGAASLNGSFAQTAVLLVSELVSNAVLHSAAPADAAIELRCALQERRLRVSVTDAGAGFTPRPRDPGLVGAGYGLYLLEKAAHRWGVEGDGRTTVWFELDR